MSGTLSYFKRLSQPIVSMASATGGPLAVIRVSGQNLGFLEKIIGPKEKAGTFKLRSLKKVSDPSSENTYIDKALVLFFEAPHSFTGEDVIEIQCHGIAATIEAIQNEIILAGASRALPGEFSFRAVVNEKMTLSEAEALQGAFAHEGISAAWASRLLGMREAGKIGTSERLQLLLEKLATARGRIEAAIDFPEAEAEQSAEIASARLRVEEVLQAQSSLLSAYENFSKASMLPRLALIGEPNAGKSTLLNILCGGNKAIVSAMPGTTRDIVEGRLRSPRGQWWSLFDTAGIRIQKSMRKDSHEQIEKAGIDLGLDAARHASLIIWVRNLDDRADPEVEALIRGLGKTTLEIFSHADKVRTHANLNAFDFTREGQKVLDHLIPRIDAALFDESGKASGEDEVISLRQHSLIEASLLDLKEAQAALEGHRPIELAGEHVRSAESKIRQAIGQGLSEDYISQIFSQFCLGK